MALAMAVASLMDIHAAPDCRFFFQIKKEE